mgnify:FL=1|jgi:hypothetical protein
MVVGGDRHADRDDDGPVSRDARDRTMQTTGNFSILDPCLAV